jgi:hypothetical protein
LWDVPKAQLMLLGGPLLVENHGAHGESLALATQPLSQQKPLPHPLASDCAREGRAWRDRCFRMNPSSYRSHYAY